MNDETPYAPQVPPTLPADNLPSATMPRPPSGYSNPPGYHPGDEVPIHGLFPALEALLREPRRVVFQLGQAGGGRLVFAMFVIATVCSLAYGFVAGTFSGGEQLWAAPVKIAGGLLCAGLICLPSLYIFACLSGAQARLSEIAGLVGGLVALLAVLLVGFAPVAWVFSQSTDYVSVMGALHIAFGLVACFFGLRFLNTGFVHFSSTARGGVNFWKFIFLLVALQMTTALRPIIGRDETFLPREKKFFLAHWAECVSGSVAPAAIVPKSGNGTSETP